MTDPATLDPITSDMGRTEDDRSLPEDYAEKEQEREFIQRLTQEVWDWLVKEVEDGKAHTEGA